MTINYYVELLSRIRSVSVLVEEEDENVVFIAKKLVQIDSKLIKLILEDEESIDIPLPIDVPQIPNLSSCFQQKGNIVSIRLPLVDAERDRSTNALMSISSNYKWNASYLRKSVVNYTFNCSSCNNPLISSTKVKSVLDMPSELWAEMMDFWHCHKPDTKSSYIEKFSSLSPEKNGIITGAYYIAFNSDDDIYGVRKSLGTIQCTGCSKIVGEYDSKVKLDKLFNWELKLCHHGKMEIFQPFYYTYDTLLDNVNGNAIRIIELSNNSNTKSILIWIFNIGLDVIVKDLGLRENSMKLYYTSDKDDIEEERKNRGEIEQVFVLDLIIDSTIQQLTYINKKLPKSSRKMGKNWKLALLYKDE